MKKINQNFTLSISQLLTLLVFIVIVIVFATTTFIGKKFIDDRFKYEMNRYLSVEIENTIMSFEHHKEMFLSVLRDYSGFSIVIDSVMNEDSEIYKMKYFFDSLVLYGKKEHMELLDFSGDIIYTTGNQLKHRYIGNNTINKLSDHKEGFLDVVEIKAIYYWYFAVPVIFNNNIEGAIVVIIPVSDLDLVYFGHSIDKSDKKRPQISLIKGNNIVLKSGPDIKQSSTRMIFSKENDVVFRFDIDITDYLESKKQMYIQAILVMIFIVFTISVFVSFLSKKYVLDPILKLNDFLPLLITTDDLKLDAGKFRVREFKKLANTLEKMSERLKKYTKANKISQIELKKEKEKAESYFDMAGTMLIALDSKGKVIKVNKKGEDILGYKKEEIIGEDWFDKFIPASNRDDIKKIFISLMCGDIGDYEIYENPIINSKGEVRAIFWNNIVMKDENNSNIGVIGSGEDITEKIKIDIEIRENRKWLTTILESIGDGVIVCDSDRRITFLNPIAEKLTGWNKTTAIGCYFEDVFNTINEQTGQKQEDLLNKILSDSKIKILPNYAILISKDDIQIPIENSMASIRDDKGEISGAVLVFHDISERRKAAKEKFGLEEKLKQSQKMEAIGILAGGIAHDFNNILAVINGNILLAQVDSKLHKKDIKDIYSEMLQASKRGADLVKNILRFSHQSEHEFLPINIVPVVKETIKFLKSSISAGINIDYNICSKMINVISNPTELQRVIMNLCTNSVHAMFANGTLTLRLYEDSYDNNFIFGDFFLRAGNYAHLIISDTGSGIEEKYIEKIFEPYFTTKKYGVGTGMGLSVVYGIVNQHSGGIKVTSKINVGTQFEVLIPTANMNDRIVEKGNENLAISELPRGTENILLVDDEEVLVEVTKKTIELLGYNVTVENDALQALETFSKFPDKFDLIISDMNMPQMNGKELALEMLKIRDNILIILYTGYSDLIKKSSIKEIGVKSLLMKPVDIDVFAKTIRKVIDESKKS